MRGEGHKARMADAADADKTLRTIALCNLAAMSVLGCLGAGAFAAAGRFDVARSIAVAAATVGILVTFLKRKTVGNTDDSPEGGTSE